MKLYEKIPILRNAKHWTQEQLGDQITTNDKGVSRQTISAWENGNFEPTLNNIRELAVLFNVSFDVLLDDSIDLNDPDTLQKVTNSMTKEKPTGVTTSVTYYIGRPYLKLKDWIQLSFTLLALAIGITMLAFGLYGNNYLLAFGITLSAVSVGVLLGCIISVFVPTIKKSGYAVGYITYASLRVDIPGPNHERRTYPLHLIEDLEVGHHFKNYLGDVIIKLKDGRKETISKIFSPQTLVDKYHEFINTEAKYNKVD